MDHHWLLTLSILVACNATPPDASTPPIAPPAPVAETAPTAWQPATAPTGAPALPVAVEFEGAPPTNILILSVDTARWDAWGRYGDYQTPWVDARMEEGVVLDNHWSCSNWTYPSMLCALGGATVHEIGSNGIDMGVMKTSHGFLPKHLADQGYAYGLVSANMVLDPVNGMFDGAVSSVISHQEPAEGVVAAGHEFLDGATGPWALHLHFIEPHQPYLVSDLDTEAYAQLPDLDYDLTSIYEYDRLKEDLPYMTPEEAAVVREHILFRYQSDVEQLDRALSQMWTELDARGALDDTLVLFFTDHGEELFDHGDFGHAGTLYRDENGAAAFFWSKNIVSAASKTLTSHIDLAPTLLDSLGLPALPDASGVPMHEVPAERFIVGVRPDTERASRVVATAPDGVRLHYWLGGLSELVAIDQQGIERGGYVPEARADELLEFLWPTIEQIAEDMDQEP